MRRQDLISFGSIQETVRPESDVVQNYTAIIDNMYMQRLKIYSPDIGTFYNFISNIPVYKFKNKTGNQWNISTWLTPEELKL